MGDGTVACHSLSLCLNLSFPFFKRAHSSAVQRRAQPHPPLACVCQSQPPLSCSSSHLGLHLFPSCQVRTSARVQSAQPALLEATWMSGTRRNTVSAALQTAGRVKKLWVIWGNVSVLLVHITLSCNFSSVSSFCLVYALIFLTLFLGILSCFLKLSFIKPYLWNPSYVSEFNLKVVETCTSTSNVRCVCKAGFTCTDLVPLSDNCRYCEKIQETTTAGKQRAPLSSSQRAHDRHHRVLSVREQLWRLSCRKYSNSSPEIEFH